MRNFDRPTNRPFDRRYGRGPGPGPGRSGRPFGAWDQVFPPGAFGRGPGRGRHGGGRRGRRGDVRAAILALLVEQPMHGYEMIQELDSRTGGIWRPSPGSVYPTLQLLEDEGLVVGEQVEGRRRFTLTDAGREVATKAAERPPWADYADAEAATEAHGLREAVGGILNALREVGMAGSDRQRAEAMDVLKDTRRKLYAILATDETDDTADTDDTEEPPADG
ncbi:MAG TPA: PadR family transcriptional regulator [Acidimicrobiales bacterium]|nr:PadR family transcriptional regulator [Acidimicrobiales bacterium]